MSMKHFDPPTDFDMNEREMQKRDAKMIARLQLNDFMRDPVEVNGMMFCADADADIVRRDADSEIDVMIDAIYIVHDVEGDLSAIKLDMDSFQTEHTETYKAIIEEVEMKASQYASTCSEDLWIYDEEEDL